MRRILVTGGCGFIGSNFIRHILSARPNLTVTNLDKLTYAGHPGNLDDLQGDRCRFVHADICDPEMVRRAMRGAEAVYHFAAESHVDRSIQDSSPFVRTNVLGTQVLLDVARELSVTRFVHVSTDEVYGSLGPTGYFTESTPLSPNSPYSASKAASDLLALSYHRTFGLPVLVTRCSNNYGPRQFPEKLIPFFITLLVRNEPVPLYGDGLNVRDWIHVRDHCEAVLRVCEQGQPGEVYNVGGRCEKTNKQITHALLTALGKPTSLIRYVQDRLGHDRRYAVDCSKLERELGWTPQISFEQGLHETVQWYLANTAWVDSIRTGEYLNYCRRQYGSLAA